jgi:hypothetical protein
MCPILSGLIGKGGVSSEARPPSLKLPHPFSTGLPPGKLIQSSHKSSKQQRRNAPAKFIQHQSLSSTTGRATRSNKKACKRPPPAQGAFELVSKEANDV